MPEAWEPHADPAVLAAVERACAARGLEPLRDQRLGRLTTLGVGGPAALYVELPDIDAVLSLQQALVGTTAEELPLFVLGKGSNTLVADAGVDALVVKLGGGLKWLDRAGDVVSAGAGEAMPALAAWVAREGLAGLEFAAGIPATVGGSVRMNAGAHGSETAARLVDVTAVLPESSGLVAFRPSDLAFDYRQSSLPPRSVVVSARWSLTPDDPVAIRGRLDELRAWRRRTQPLRERTCGSVFTNPDGDSAGRLVEAAGLKGHRIGGASVSIKHANFIVAGRDPDTGVPATAADVQALIGAVRAAVLADSGVLLEPEVRLVGSFS
jgi:UDP-N-acetylmuramate dehydrogenase